VLTRPRWSNPSARNADTRDRDDPDVANGVVRQAGETMIPFVAKALPGIGDRDDRDVAKAMAHLRRWQIESDSTARGG
jgi:hypothetical protein